MDRMDQDLDIQQLQELQGKAVDAAGEQSVWPEDIGDLHHRCSRRSAALVIPNLRFQTIFPGPDETPDNFESGHRQRPTAGPAAARLTHEFQ